MNLLGIDDQHQVYVLPRGNRLLATGEVGGGGYDLNDGQKKLLASWYFPAAGEKSRKWIGYFSTVDSGKQQIIRSLIIKPLQQWTEEMLYLGVVIQSGDYLELSGEHAWIRAYSIEQPPLTLEELQVKLELQLQAGLEAEENALRIEKRRLLQLGLVEESNRAERVSDRLVNAGYDILSFSSSSPDPNRYIEVKSVGPDRSFYWSRHELEVAKVLGSQYFLYLVNQTDPIVDPIIDIIQDPFSYLSLYALMEPTQYKVSF